jgi:hypothetical protein
MSWGPPDQGQQPGQWGAAPPQGQEAGQWQQPPGWQPQQPPGQWQQPPPGSQPPQGQWQQPPQGQWQQPPPGWQPPPGQWGPPPPPGWQPPPGQPPPPGQWGPTPEQGGWWGGPSPIGDAYPINVSFDRRARFSRFWGIPILGFLIRSIALIPHYIVLAFVGIGVWLLVLVTWIGVLVNGRFPRIGYRWAGGYLRWVTRVGAWLWLLSSAYPPFSLSSDEHPVRVRIEEGEPINRLWGVPLLGYLVRAVFLIPHFIVLWAISILVGIILVFNWLPVLINGRQAQLVYSIVGGYLRWAARVWGYFALMTDRYPPFSLGEDDPAPVW